MQILKVIHISHNSTACGVIFKVVEYTIDHIELAVAVRDNAVEARRTARVSVRSARENLQMVEEQRSVGDVSRIELSDSISEYSAALGSRVSAFYNGQRAEAALFALLGRYPEFKNEKVEAKK